jgi:phosphohistidine phosphatase
MDLVIVRHAIAMERDARQWPDDDLRPLSEPGIARGRKAAAGLAHLMDRPGHVLASPLLRAQQTARILERYALWPHAEVCADLVPETPPDALLRTLARIDSDCVGVVGHEPHLSELLAHCLPGAAQRGITFRKMGAGLVRFPGRVRAGHGHLVWFAPPRLLRAARKSD